MRVELKDAIRWLDLGHKMVLQVRQLVFKPEGGEGQGTYDEVWVDVPVVIPGQSKQQSAHLTGQEDPANNGDIAAVLGPIVRAVKKLPRK